MLWEKGPSTVREVHEALSEARAVRYTTTLKQLQVMLDKGLAARDEEKRSHVYRATLSEEETQTQLLDHFLAHAFGGSKSKLFLRALSTTPTSSEELEQIRTLLEQVEEEK